MVCGCVGVGVLIREGLGAVEPNFARSSQFHQVGYACLNDVEYLASRRNNASLLHNPQWANATLHLTHAYVLFHGKLSQKDLHLGHTQSGTCWTGMKEKTQNYFSLVRAPHHRLSILTWSLY